MHKKTNMHSISDRYIDAVKDSGIQWQLIAITYKKSSIISID